LELHLPILVSIIKVHIPTKVNVVSLIPTSDDVYFDTTLYDNFITDLQKLSCFL